MLQHLLSGAPNLWQINERSFGVMFCWGILMYDQAVTPEESVPV